MTRPGKGTHTQTVLVQVETLLVQYSPALL